MTIFLYETFYPSTQNRKTLQEDDYMPEIIAAIDFVALAEIFGGLMIFIYALSNALAKIFGNVGVFKKRKEAKLEIEKKKKEEEFQTFLKSASSAYLDPITTKIDKLINSSNDMLRKEITRIYYKYLPFKALPRYVKEELVTMYNDYKAQNGNSFVKDIFEEMKLWDTVNSEEDLRIKN